MGLGCFPFDNETYLTLSDSRLSLSGIRSLIEFGNLSAPSSFSALPAVMSTLRLALKLFRREPAISEFDWNFSANHSSSPTISTGVGSDLHEALPSLHPDHGEVTRFRVEYIQLDAPFRLAFASAPHLKCLTLPVTFTRRTILQKVPYHTLTCFMCL